MTEKKECDCPVGSSVFSSQSKRRKVGRLRNPVYRNRCICLRPEKKESSNNKVLRSRWFTIIIANNREIKRFYKTIIRCFYMYQFVVIFVLFWNKHVNLYPDSFVNFYVFLHINFSVLFVSLIYSTITVLFC